MSTADRLLDEIFSWIEQRESCAAKLRKLARELEELRKKCKATEFVGSSVAVAGAACLIGAGVVTLCTGGAAAPFLGVLGAAYTGVGTTISVAAEIIEHFISSDTMEEAQKVEKKSDRIAEEIQRLFRKLKTEKKEVNRSADPDELDQHVMTEVMKAMARRMGVKHKINVTYINDEPYFTLVGGCGLGGLKPMIVNEAMVSLAGILSCFAYQLNGKKYKFLFTKGTEQLIKLISTNGFKTLLKGGAKVVGGAVGMAFALSEAIDNWKDLIKKNHVTEASQSLRDTADAIKKMTQTLREQLDSIKRMLKKVVQRQQEQQEELARERKAQQEIERKRRMLEEMTKRQQEQKELARARKAKQEIERRRRMFEEMVQRQQEQKEELARERKAQQAIERKRRMLEEMTERQQKEEIAREIKAQQVTRERQQMLNKNTVHVKKENHNTVILLIFLGILCFYMKPSVHSDHSVNVSPENEGVDESQPDQTNEDSQQGRQPEQSKDDDERESDQNEQGGGEQPGGDDQGDEESDSEDEESVESDEDGESEEETEDKERNRDINQPPPAEVRVGLLNVRSINNKRSTINELITQNNLDLFLPTETWLQGDTADEVLSEALPPNFNSYNQHRDGRRGGGVAIQFSPVLQGAPLYFNYLTTFECVGAVLQHETWDEPILFLNVYHPPGYTLTRFRAFLDEFQMVLDDVSEQYSSIIVTGDFNIWVDFEKRTATDEFEFLLLINNLFQHVGEPTQRSGHFLDLVISRNVDIPHLVVRDDGISDHYTVYFNVKPKSTDTKKTKTDEDEKVKRLKRQEE
ncbi:uncharacterized protein LOC114440035 isoform X2 [Parambassis ranga]|uniref:Uncharacterized protein LOC114440035 isoform X2 n=1 Tax=Parambassis ranga TaxID=210632 RepID=A0A6P7IIL6_9TELE|nr:uncharacterized protein LOC114440035 isoform X2 [Parambassis ranga]